MLVNDSEFAFPVICPSTGPWIPHGTVHFAAPKLTLAAQIGLVRGAVLAGLKGLGLADLVVRGLDLTVLRIYRPFDGIVCGVDSDGLLPARQKLFDFNSTRPLRTCADMARPF